MSEPAPERLPNGHKRPPFRFTRENAREMLARSREAHKRNEALRDAAAIAGEPVPSVLNRKHDAFVAGTLTRVRVQMRRLDDMLDQETDPAKLDRLAAAFGRLAEIEQRLADRPLPGSRRPTPERHQSRLSSLLGSQDPPAHGPRQGQE